jgi:hypothetical protein
LGHRATVDDKCAKKFKRSMPGYTDEIEFQRILLNAGKNAHLSPRRCRSRREKHDPVWLPSQPQLS